MLVVFWMLYYMCVFLYGVFNIKNIYLYINIGNIIIYKECIRVNKLVIWLDLFYMNI